MKIIKIKTIIISILLIVLVLSINCSNKSVDPKIDLAPAKITTFEKNLSEFCGGVGLSILQTSDKNIVLTGKMGCSEGDLNCLIKIDNNGDKIWSKHIGGYIAWSVSETTDEGFISTGYHKEINLIRTNKDGDILWEKTYGKGEGYAVSKTSDGGFIVTGWGEKTSSRWNIVLIKTDSDGNLLWENNFYNGDGQSVIETPDKGYLIACRGYIEGSYSALSLIKTDSLGNFEWVKSIPVEITEMKKTKDNNLIVVGSRVNDNHMYKACILKIDFNGKILL